MILRLLFLTAFSGILFSQVSHNYFQPQKKYEQGKELFLLQLPEASADALQNLDDTELDLVNPEALDFYVLMTEFQRQIPEAPKNLDEYEFNYPNSIYAQSANFTVGTYYFFERRYNKALNYFSKVDRKDLAPSKREEFDFHSAYSLYKVGAIEEALGLFERSISVEEYRLPASYYSGHINYKLGNYEKALKHLKPLQEEGEAYEEIVQPYLVQINFNNKKYEQTIVEAQKLLESDNLSPQQKNETEKILGESFFNLKKYAQAIPHLENYTKNKYELNTKDYYQLGFAYYKIGQNDEAIANFNKILDSENPLAQTAYYQLAVAYFNAGDKVASQNAFHSASNLSYNRDLSEAALYNYAKLSYEIGNATESVPEVLNRFVKTYPSSSQTPEIYTLLIDSYFSSGDYRGVLKLLDDVNNKTVEMLGSEQLAAFLLGIELFNNQEYTKSAPYLARASKITSNNEIQARSYYYLAENLYELEDFKGTLKALISLEKINANYEEKHNFYYLLGYAQFKNSNYEKAISAFNKYLRQSRVDFRNDAKLRLADSYFALRDLDKAESMYAAVIQSPSGDSEAAQFQSALLYGLKGNHQEKIASLNTFLNSYPSSTYAAEAQFEIGEAHLALGNNSNAKTAFEKVSQSENAQWKYAALLKLGLIAFNQGNRTKALANYEKVATERPETEDALQAIAGARQVFIESSDIQGFQTWVAQFDYFTLDENELEELSYTSAETTFLRRDFGKSVRNFEQFIRAYPNSNRINSANFYLAESFFQQGNKTDAVKYFEKIKSLKNDNQPQVLWRLARIYNETSGDKAVPFYRELINKYPESPYFDESKYDLMVLLSELENHREAEKLANDLLNKNELNSIKRDQAKLIKARSLWAQNQQEAALKIFNGLQTAESTETRAEALYYKALQLRNSKSLKQSNDVIFDIASNYPEQQYWGARSLLIMAENYRDLDDPAQAKFILESLIENYSQYPDVVDEAQVILNRLNN